MQIIDAQIHVWANAMPPNPRHRQVMSFTPEDALVQMDEAGVDGAVIHPPSWHRDVIDMAKAAIREHPGRFAVMGLLSLDLKTPQAIAEACALIEGWRSEPGVLGLRPSFGSDTARQRLADRSLDPVWAAAERAGVPMTAMVTDYLGDIAGIAERFPGLRFSIDHLGGRGGSTELKDAEAMTHMAELLALAKFPNVAVKVTGAPYYSGEDYPFPKMQSYLRQIYDAFGPARCFWGTDISKMPCSWRECVTMFTEELPWLTGRELDLVMGDAVCAWWDWDRAASAR
jgi:predicted TIM-barrel fold metal-dependent hydrolase